MKKSVIILSAIVSLGAAGEAGAKKTDGLDVKQQKMVAIAVNTATGRLDALRTALNAGLDSGLTVNAIKEELVQLYAYCGFPGSLQGLNTFMVVMEERKKAGIEDETGPEASLITDNRDKYTRGREILKALTGIPQDSVTGVNAFAPAIDIFLKEHLFADIFERDILTFLERELVTISALAAMEGVEPMLRSHLLMGINTGLTASILEEVMEIIGTETGQEREVAGRKILKEVLQTVNN